MEVDEFDLQFGPLPDWAIAFNREKLLVPGAQLCTKDGRRTGNAHVVHVEARPEHGRLYHLLTDAGTPIAYVESEVLSAFWVGDFVSDVQEVIRKFDRDNHYHSTLIAAIGR